MNITFGQLAIAIVAIGFIVHRLHLLRKGVGSQSFIKVASFVGIWVIVLIFALFPQFPRAVSTHLGLGNSLNTLIFMGFVVVFSILYKILSLIEKLERQITEMVRKDALENKSNEKKL